ncbi:hypothetical protein O181_082351 [Austropuccinia psidii MF-1]|uniref:Uncharacterized protein n=1 Tax=Austropuccinia psidii MF-1 TaxID=1389203 RepID=A0A9Q3IGU5_9BASI|nr:hypothetical protein [Austropuccinia psidii MF-1]
MSPKCHVISRTHQGSSAGVISQRPRTPSGTHWLFSLQVLPPREYCQFIPKVYSGGSSKQVVNFQCSINPTWQPHSFQYSLASSRPVFQSHIMGKSFNTVHFPIWKVIVGTPLRVG